jgi:hypothetical protein
MNQHAIDEQAETIAFDWQRAHAELLRLAQTRAELDWEEGRWLLCALRAGSHIRLGYGSFAEYVERLFGYAARWTGERLRVAEALDDLPETAQALRDGALSWSTVRELTRVATPKTESEWIEAARDRTVREVEQLVSGHRPGDRPDDPADRDARRHVLRFEVSAETAATVREAQAKLRREAGDPLDDDAVLLLMARSALGGPTDEGRSSYQVALTVCEGCGRGYQQAKGELVEVGPEVVEMAACDAQHVGSAHAGNTHAGVDGAAHADKAHDSNVDVGTTERRVRATQSIPPAVRRQVMRRDNSCCKVPGCRQAVFVDIHHIDPRAEGGAHDADNLIVACAAHHRAHHRGQLIIEGRVSTDLRFLHADGSPYGGNVSPRAAEARQQAFRALRGLGFRETETRRALNRVAAHVGAAATTETIVRQALRVLTSPSS